MNREAQDSLLLLVGAMVLQIGLTDLHLRYVKPAMQPLLILTGLGLVAIGALGVVRQVRGSAGAQVLEGDGNGGNSGEQAGGHEHHGQPRTAWLLVLPLLVMATVTPPTLGAYAAARGTTTVEQPEFRLPPLPAPTNGAIDVTLTEYYSRVLYDPASLDGATLRMTGFVTPVGAEWFVTRMRLSCCAADGRPVKVLTDGPASRPAPPADTWVEVVGTVTAARPPAGEDSPVAVLAVSSVRGAPRPTNAYEE